MKNRIPFSEGGSEKAPTFTFQDQNDCLNNGKKFA